METATANSTEYVKGQLYFIPLANLQPDPNQPRKVMDAQALDELTASVQRHGVLEPVLFRQDDGGLLYCVAGERRCAAAKNAGLLQVPALFVDGNEGEIALVENLMRQDLTPVEEAEGLQRLMDEQKYTQEQLGTMIGKARTTVGDILTLNRLPQAIRDDCRGDRQISRATLIDIARKKQERGMSTAYNSYKAKQQKGKTTRQKKDPNEPQSMLDMMDKTATKIKAVDTSAWADDDKAGFQAALTNLRAAIDNLLATAEPTKTATKKPSKKLS
ncbi:MAG: ParB/RepB/Spo0J family partition protein [Syntrophales bacterium]|nr:ParB/RepB/Spo0J family partition protein [Syntrophales bacterium]